MSENEVKPLDYNRRDFLKGGSVATLMGLMGGVPLFAKPGAEPVGESKPDTAKYKVAIIGLGRWGREILNTLTLAPGAKPGYQVEVAGICDNYPSALRRAGELVPGAIKTEDYTTLLANKDIPAVIIATPTHKHAAIVIAALKAGKHVYCEAPLANTIEEARAIALAAKDAPKQIFQAGLQDRSDPERLFLLPFIREGNLGKNLFTRGQYHKKYSWRQQSPNAQREKDLNWCLDKTTSLGLLGETGIHPLDQATWFYNQKPAAITAFGSVMAYAEDGRDVADTVQAVCEFRGGARAMYDATLGNSFEANYEVFYGTNGAILIRDSKAWMFKETDSPLFGWEVYARKTQFYTEFQTTGISLMAGASKGAVTPAKEGDAKPALSGALFSALGSFVRNCNDYTNAITDYTDNFGDDAEGLVKHLAEKVHRRAAAGYLEGYQATVTVVKANEALLTGKRVEIPRELYELK